MFLFCLKLHRLIVIVNLFLIHPPPSSPLNIDTALHTGLPVFNNLLRTKREFFLQTEDFLRLHDQRLCEHMS